VKDKEIDGSPFRVVVKIPPTQLGQPVHQIEGLEGPWGIAINNKQQLLIAESDGKKISIMERDGKKVQTIECAKFQYPRGVAAGPDGAVYVTDIGAHCLFKFDTKGKLVNTVFNELHKPYSVKIIHNQLYVVDNASFLVKIFDMDCNVVGTIQTKECPNPRDIAQGPDGLYVAGEKKISVYRCAPNGNFIRHLNIQPSSLNLSEFWGVCVDISGHIIATDCCNGVYVFNPSGECVGHVSSDVISQPVGVTVDEDGFVYVCGFRSSNVLVL
jgi:DNA-binding beta-propeller fold protein YncE